MVKVTMVKELMVVKNVVVVILVVMVVVGNAVAIGDFNKLLTGGVTSVWRNSRVTLANNGRLTKVNITRFANVASLFVLLSSR